MGDWIILRVASSQTLHLAASLNDAGFEAWSPAIAEERRTGPLRTRKEVLVPLMPSWVFARSEGLLELLALSHAPSLQYRVWDADKRHMVTKGHPRFSFLRDGTGYARAPDRDLVCLRRAERKGKPKEEVRVWVRGDRVRLTEGAFAGLVGVVEGSSGNYTTVVFAASRQEWKFASWWLEPALDEQGAVNVSSAQSEQAMPAKAA